MDITKAMIEARLERLRGGQEELLSSLHATNGAIQEAEYWLAQLTVPAMATTEDLNSVEDLKETK